MDDLEFVGIEEAEGLHSESLQRLGGKDGVLDRGLIISSLHAAKTTYFYACEGKSRRESVASISAKYLERLIVNHGFVDGNKRVAILCFKLFLAKNGYWAELSAKDAKSLCQKIASRQITYFEITELIAPLLKELEEI